MRKLSVLFVLLTLVAGTGPRASVLAQYTNATGVEKLRAAKDEKLGRIFKSYERFQLDARRAAAGVRRNGQLQIATPNARFALRLTVNDLRAANYRAVRLNAGGAESVLENLPVETYRGAVEGDANAEARFSVNDQRVEGIIITSSERYYVEPLKRYDPSAALGDYILYRASDVRTEAPVQDASVTLNHKVNRLMTSAGRAALVQPQPQTATTLREVELATEADFEYVSAQGSAAQANNEILSIINQVDGVYQREVGLTFRVVFQSAWDTPNDPYTATTLTGILNEFTNYWNANRLNVLRDLAHMWTGKAVGGLGVSWQGTVCLKPNNSYGVSPLLRDVPQKFIITAHEIGHSFNATHPTDPACNNTIMSTISGPSSTETFCQPSRNEITSFVNANSGCLTVVTPGGTWVPAQPNQTELQTWTVNGITYAKVKLTFFSAGYRVASWGQVTRSGNTFTVDAVVERFTGPTIQAVATTVNIYELGVLSAGQYTFTFRASGASVLSQQFTVSNTPPAPNPIDTTEFFVAQQYRDFLAREPDAAGLAFWSDNINLCNDPARRPAGQTVAQCIDRQRTTTSAAFFLSPEFQTTGYFVYRVYKGSLGRRPFFSEFIPDQRLVANNIILGNQLSGPAIEQNKRTFAEQFVNRSEFVAIYGGLTNQQYVDKLFATTGVVPTQAERDALVAGLNNATETRATVLMKVVDGILVVSEGNQQFTTRYGREFYNKEFNPAFVVMEYFGYMRRDPDEPGYNFWLSKLTTFGNYIDAEMVRSFIVSPEYRARFGAP